MPPAPNRPLFAQPSKPVNNCYCYIFIAFVALKLRRMTIPVLEIPFAQEATSLTLTLSSKDEHCLQTEN